MNEKLLKVEIVTPQKPVFKGTATSIKLPGALSAFEILINHAPIVSSLEPGVVQLTNESGSDFYFAVSSGFIENLNNNVSVMVEFADRAEDINVELANKKIEELKQQKVGTTDLIKLDAISYEIAVFQARINAANKIR
jgi:F-type H+-transporting ATPase subunit epsilon